MSGRKRGSSRETTILEHVVACLTGMPQDEKERLHGLVEAMGGRFTRDLNSVENTHLVACEPVGAKYEAAVQLLQTTTTTTTGTIQIVRPSWIEACWKQQQLVDCGEHSLLRQQPPQLPVVAVVATTDHNEEATNVEIIDAATAAIRPPQQYSLEQVLNQQLDATSRISDNSCLFSACHFGLVGFQEDNDEDRVVHAKLTRLIRRCMGTIYWNDNDTVSVQDNCITHVIVKNGYMDEATRDAVTSRTSSGPAFLSPWWVVHSCRDGKLLPCSNSYIPECRCVVAIKKQKLVATTEKSSSGHRPVVPPIFRGSVFVLLRVVPPAWAVDFDSTELETVIAQHGGQMLSHALLDALKADQAAAAAATTTTQQRTCYVVCWGGPSTHDLHPLLSQVKRYQLCDVQPVTPIWLQTCATEQKCIHPSRLPELFQPNNRPIHSFSKHQYGKGEKQVDTGSSIRISLTGFSGSQRTAMIRLIAAMRGIYDDSMRTATTHLICREAGVGQKYEKAVEWKLHIVTCAWLYHVAQYGFDGEPPSEERFAVAPPPTCYQ